MPQSRQFQVGLPNRIHVHAYPPPLPGVKPILPDALVENYLANMLREPNENPLECPVCKKRYDAPFMNGRECVTSKNTPPCRGMITRRWNIETARAEVVRYYLSGDTAIAWEIGSVDGPASPIGFVVCDVCTPSSVIGAIDFPMTVLSTIYSKAGRNGPYLVLSLWLGKILVTQDQLVLDALIKKVVESVMKREGFTQATILILVDGSDAERRHRLLKQSLAAQGKYDIYACDKRPGRNRALVGFKLSLT